jgi:hypothetical protein
MLDHSRLLTVPCPNCATMGLKLSLVDHLAIVRNYSQSISDIPPPPQSLSPIRIGDSFDDLKRKMIKFSCQKEKYDNMSGNHNDDFVEALIDNPNLVTALEIYFDNEENMLNPTVNTEIDIDESQSTYSHHTDVTVDTSNIESSSFNDIPDDTDFGVVVSYVD